MWRRVDGSVLVGAGLIAVLLVVIALLNYLNTRQLDEDSRWVTHTHEVLEMISELQRTLVNAESSQRGFFITGNEAYLDPYETAIRRFEALLESMKRLTSDNTRQQRRIDELADLAKRRLARLKLGIETKRKSEDQARALAKSTAGKAQMEAVQALVSQMRDEEHQLLAGRRSRSERAYETAISTSLLSSLIGLTLIAALVWLLQRSLIARQRAASILHEQREWFRTTLAAIGDAVIATDTEGNVRFLNPVAQTLTAWGDDEAQGQPLQAVFNIVNEQTREAAENPAVRAVRDGMITGLANHTILIARDGTERPIDDSAAPIRNADGNTIGAVLVFRDITARKHAEQEIARLLSLEQARSGRLKQVAQASLTINAATSPLSVADVIRDEARRIIGATQAEVCLEPGQDPPADGLTAQLSGRGETRAGYIHLVAKSDGSFTGDDDAILTQLAHMAAVALDNVRLNEELRENDRRKDEFLATLAHELRNPLAPIRNSIYVMKMAGHDLAKIENSREIIERQLKQMVRLVDELLDISRISGGKIVLQKKRIDLATVLAIALETSRPLIDQAGHQITLDLPSEPIPLFADPTRLAQVFMNLLNNAAKYTERGGMITLLAERDGDWVTVKVKDSGIGIPATMISRIFDMFTQVDRSLERVQGGLGIGLTLVKRLVEMHGGTVEARSDGAEKGSEFVVRLPLAPRAQAEQPLPGAKGLAASAHLRILVVDDNWDSVDSLATMLRMMGNEVRTAHDGIEAVQAARTFQPEWILMDIGLPGLNGFDAARQIRGSPGGSVITMVAVTGWGQEEDRRRSKEAGFNHHIVKPVDPTVLEELLAGFGSPGKGASPLLTPARENTA
jgi:PAS domain S-box-containing protein